MCMCTFSDESLIIEVGKSFEKVTNGWHCSKKFKMAAFNLTLQQQDVAITSTSTYVYKLLASLENGDWRKKRRPSTQPCGLRLGSVVGRSVVTT